jgi:hypothetical protein
VVAVLAVAAVAGGVAFLYWPRGLDLRDGRHDLGRNGAWLQHGWLGHRQWFERYGKLDKLPRLRDPSSVRALARTLRRHGVRDLYPHLCPADHDGQIPPVDDAATTRFLDAHAGFRVMPWVGGVLGKNALPDSPGWREEFVHSAVHLLKTHPRLAGLHVNIEPCPSGHAGFLKLLDQLRAALPAGKILSVAAYPPPTLFHPHPEIHWDETYYRSVAKRVHQVVPMMYDTSLRFSMVYRRLMAAWTREVLTWSAGAEVLLGLPAYEDQGVGYHVPEVENLEHAIAGVHQGLAELGRLPPTYNGVAVYSEWTMTPTKWSLLRERFLKVKQP